MKRWWYGDHISENWFVFFDRFGDVLVGDQFLACLTLSEHVVCDNFAQALVIIDELRESHLQNACTIL